jgi:hypothetical protein
VSVDPAEEEEVFVKNQVDLAAHLDVERKSIGRWMKKPGCPGKEKGKGFSVTKWRAWKDKHRLGRSQGNKLANLKEEGEALKNEKQRLLNQRLRGESLDVDEVCKVVCDMLSGFVLQFRQTLPTMADEASGVDPGEALKRLRLRTDEVLEELSLGEWAKKKMFWSTVYARLQSHRATLDLGHGPSSTSMMS